MVCWGDNTSDQSDAPATSFTQVSAGWRHSCGRRPDATVVCWGSDTGGQAPQARLASLSLTLAGTNLIAFNPDVTEYSIVAEPGQADLAYTVADHETSGPSAEAFPLDANTDPTDRMSAGHQVELVDGLVVEVRVDSLLEFGVSRTYRIRVSSPPRLSSLSVVPVGSGPQCTPACAPLALDPAFDPEVFYYRAVAPADLSRVTVAYTAVGGRASVSPEDADAEVPGDQVALSSGRGFVEVSAGSSHVCGIKTGGAVACWGDSEYGQTVTPSGSFSVVSAGGYHACALNTGGAAVCWGARARWLEPAKSEAATIEITSRAHPAILARYTVRLNRSKPVRATVRGAGADPAPDQRPPGRICWDGRPCDGVDAECALPALDCPQPQPGDDPGPGDRAQPQTAPDSVPNGPADNSVPSPRSHESSPPSNQNAPRDGTGSNDPPDGSTGETVCPARPGDATPDTVAAIAVADTTLHAGINRHLDKAPGAAVTASEMAELTALEMPAGPGGGRVVSLSGLEHATNLTSLDLNGHNVSDISALACLDSLTTVDLAGNDITDISALTGLSGLTTLGLAGNTIADVSALSGLTSLSALDLSDNDIAAVGPLAGLSGLRSLNVGQNEISDVTALRGLTGLETLYAYNNQITGIAALSGLTSLTRLHLDHNHITGIAALASLTTLTTLGLGGNQINDIAPLRSLTALEMLYLFDNDIADPSALSSLTSLKVLWIDGNDLASPYRWAPTGGLGYLDARHNLIADIAPLDALAATGGSVHTEPQRVATVRVNDASLRAALLAALGKTTGDTLSPAEIATIERLQRAGPASDPAPITDLSGLEHATALRVLRLRNNTITDIAPISALSGLTELDLHTNNLSDLSQLRGLTSIETLSLVNNRLDSLDTLPALPRLESLFVDLNQIRDLTPLRHRATLAHLGLFANNITDITPLEQLTALESLTLSLNNIADITPLSELTALKELRLEHTRTTDLQALKTLTAMQFLHLGHNQITSLEPLEGLTGLRTLDLQNNRITSLEPLTGLKGLRNLYLQNNNITSLEPLAGLPNLRRLHIGGNNITDLTPLDGIAGLTIHGRNHQTPRN